VSRLTRTESQSRTSDRLIEAARSAVAEHGFGAVSVDRIAERAGYSRGAFYANFDSKEALLLAVLRRHMESEIGELRALFDERLEQPALVQSLERWLRNAHADADWALLSAEMQLHALRSSTFAVEYGALQRDHRRALGDILTRLFASAGRALPIDADVLAATLKALVQGLALQNASRAGNEERIDSMRIIRLVLQALIQIAPAC
jgi:AcrR family transcriptional regulator